MATIVAALITSVIPKLLETEGNVNSSQPSGDKKDVVNNINKVLLQGVKYNNASAHVRIGDEGFYIGWINDGEWIRFENVNFGESELRVAKVRYASGETGGVMTIHLDEPQGRKIASCYSHGTGGWKNWTTVACQMHGSVTGIHDVYVLFTGKGTYIANVDWIEFGS